MRPLPLLHQSRPGLHDPRRAPRLTDLLFQLAHLVLFIIIVGEADVEDGRGGEHHARQARQLDEELRVLGGRAERDAEQGADGAGEQVEGDNEGFHRGWGFSEGVFHPGHVGEDLGESGEHVGGDDEEGGDLR